MTNELLAAIRTRLTWLLVLASLACAVWAAGVVIGLIEDAAEKDRRAVVTTTEGRGPGRVIVIDPEPVGR